MSEKKSWLMQLGEKVQSIITKQKESDMDQKKEQEYQERIAALDTQVKEFAEKERLANEAKAKADADAAKAVADAADATLKDGIKSFCDMAVTEARMTPAMREKDEPLMFTLGKSSPDALKSFQEKYAKPVVELGEHKEVNVTGKGDNRPKVIQNAAKYVETHPKEFSGLSAEMAVSRAVYLYSTGQIKFEGTTNNTKEA